MKTLRSLTGTTLACTLTVLIPLDVGHASTLTVTPSATTDVWDPETGQSIPTGTAGYVGGTLNASSTNTYLFIYGGNGLLPNDNGHGDSSFLNSFWVGTSESAAAAAGQVFCTRPGLAVCNNIATAVGAQFAVTLSAGAIPFGFTFGSTHGNTLTNGQTNNQLGAYIAQIGTGTTANGNAGPVAYLGLSDNTYPGLDHDFQDMVVTVTTIPEPAALLLTGLGLIAAGLLPRKRR